MSLDCIQIFGFGHQFIPENSLVQVQLIMIDNAIFYVYLCSFLLEMVQMLESLIRNLNKVLHLNPLNSSWLVHSIIYLA